MKKAAAYLAVISIVVFIIAWGLGGLMIYDGDYRTNTWVYVGLAAFAVFFCSLLCLKSQKCPHCGKTNLSLGKFCPYCGTKLTKGDS